MKLHDAVVMGRFCGLETVEECLNNIRFHYNMFSYKEFPGIWADLMKEYEEFQEGTLKLDWKAINEQVEKDMDAYVASMEAQENKEYNEVVLDVF